MKHWMVFFLAVLFCLCFFYFLFFNKTKTIFCVSEQVVNVMTVDATAKMDTSTSILLYGDGKGLVKNLGRIVFNGENFEVNRTLYIQYTDDDNDGIYNVIINEEKLSPGDTVPSEIFHKYFLPEKPGDIFLVKMKILNRNALVISGLSNPYFICKTQ